MKANKILILLVFLFTVSCTRIENIKTSDTKDYSAFIKNAQIRFEEVKETDFQMNTLRSNWTNTFFIDKNSVSLSLFEEAIIQEQIPILLTKSRLMQRVQKVDVQGPFTETESRSEENDDKDDEEKPDAIFYFQNEVHGFTFTYLNAHQFDVEFLDFYVNQYDNLFMSLGSNHTGPLLSTTFNTDNGFGFGGYTDNEYDGTFLEGHLIQNIDSLSDLTIVVMIGDSIHIGEFTKHELLDVGVD